MNQPTPEKRKYDNSSREAQSQQTRQNILNALARQLVSNNSTEFSVAEAADQAGVTSRTLFRYFPTKEDMLQALSEWVFSITGKTLVPTTASEVTAAVSSYYSMFEEHPDLIRAMLLSELGRGVRSRMTTERRRTIGNALQPAVAHLPEAEAKAVRALIGHLVTAETWWQLRDAFGVDGHQSQQVVNWTIELMLQALASGQHPFPASPPAREDKPAD